MLNKGRAETRSPLAPAAPTRLAVIGASTGRSLRRYDGVYDHAMALAEALGRNGVSCTLHWLWREELSLMGARSEFRAWRQRLQSELDQPRPRAALLHYSVFEYSHRGVPVFVRAAVAALRHLRIPVIVFAHEYAFPWRLAGWRGKVWSLTQRAALVEVVRASTALIVATDARAEWLGSRRWLPRRPIRVAPVFSNLPAPSVGRSPDHHHLRVGLFTYSHTEPVAPLVLEAISLLRDGGLQVQLKLIGRPGRSSSAGEAWLEAARARGAAQALSFAGVLPAQACSDALASSDVLLCVDPAGPTARRGSLAASLASGTPVVAIDGPDCWSELRRADAARLVSPTPAALAGAIKSLAADEVDRGALGERGRAFAEQQMGIARTVGALTALLDAAAAGP